jgi:hypothetical protein
MTFLFCFTFQHTLNSSTYWLPFMDLLFSFTKVRERNEYATSGLLGCNAMKFGERHVRLSPELQPRRQYSPEPPPRGAQIQGIISWWCLTLSACFISETTERLSMKFGTGDQHKINLVINSGDAKAMVRHLWKDVKLHEQHYNEIQGESTN